MPTGGVTATTTSGNTVVLPSRSGNRTKLIIQNFATDADNASQVNAYVGIGGGAVALAGLQVVPGGGPLIFDKAGQVPQGAIYVVTKTGSTNLGIYEELGSQIS